MGRDRFMPQTTVQFFRVDNACSMPETLGYEDAVIVFDTGIEVSIPAGEKRLIMWPKSATTWKLQGSMQEQPQPKWWRRVP